MKDPQEMNSQELKELINNAGANVPSEGRDADLVRMDQAQARQEAYEDLSPAEQLNYHGLSSPEQEDDQQKTAAFGVAVNLDLMDLNDKYENPVDVHGNNLVDKFARDVQRGKVRIPEGIEKIPNAVEYIFTQIYVPEQKVAASELGKFAAHGDEFGNILDPEKTIPLQSRSMDVVRPDRVRPTPQPRQRRVEKTVKLPDLSTEDMQEMLADWSRKHPERFR
jgi:hypothetical protein